MRVIILFVGFFLLTCTDKKGQDIREIVAKINKKCPVRLDSETRLDSITLPGKKKIVYFYTLVNTSLAKLDTDQFQKDLRPGILSTIRLSPEMKQMREEGYTVVYQYTDGYHKPVSTIKIVPADYQEK
jgi:hypothetical protein